MKTKLKKLFTTGLVLCIMMTMLPALPVHGAEKFNLSVGETYYFDLSGEAGIITGSATLNTALPDETLQYVPFTYVGTINAYSLTNASSGDASASNTASLSPTDRSLFVSDYNISNYISWASLNDENLIFGKTYDTDYKLRVLSAGNEPADRPTMRGGTPTNNEWDKIYEKNSGYIKNTGTNDNLFRSWGQDTGSGEAIWRAVRGGTSALYYEDWDNNIAYDGVSWRPALEVSSSLAADELNGITLDLNGGYLGDDNTVTTMNIAYTGATYTAPDDTNLIPPGGFNATGFAWNTTQNGSGDAYTPGSNVPSSVTTLYAQWTRKTHNMVAGANQILRQGQTGSFTSDGEYADFQSVEVDGNPLTKGTDYTDSEGSTIITLLGSYTETLSLGEHTIEIISSTGVAETQFTVVANGLPETGDNTALPIFVALMLASALGMGTMFVFRKKSMAAREK